MKLKKIFLSVVATSVLCIVPFLHTPSAYAQSNNNNIPAQQNNVSIELSPDSLNSAQKQTYDQELKKGNKVKAFLTKKRYTVITSASQPQSKLQSPQNTLISPASAGACVNLGVTVYDGWVRVGFTTGYMNASYSGYSAYITDYNVTPYSYTGTAWNTSLWVGYGNNSAILHHGFTLVENYPAWGMQQAEIPFYGSYEIDYNGNVNISVY